jgi:tetratricopeptide (TPR) repeat protein
VDASLQDALEEMAAFLPSFGVSLLHFHTGEAATIQIGELNEAQMIRMLPDLASFDLEDPYPWAEATYRFHRPEILHALRTAFKLWSDEHGHSRTVVLFVGVPRTPLDAVLLGELALDTQALFMRREGWLPCTVRFLVAPRRPYESTADLPICHLFADLEQTYFDLRSWPWPASENAEPERPAASPYDITVWVDAADGSQVVHFLRDLLRLHGDENAELEANRPLEDAMEAPPTSLLEALEIDGARRRIDWLALCDTTCSPRLFTAGLPALMSVLDIRQNKKRAKDPRAGIARYEREAGWDSNLVVQTYLSQLDEPRSPQEDLLTADFPYRITDEDRASKLEMTRYLSDTGRFDLAVKLGEELLEDDPHHRLLNRILGTDLLLAGNGKRARDILKHCIELTEVDPHLHEAERADEIATIYHLMNDYDAAISGYERAIDADPLNAHAYQGLILIHRGLGETTLADHWLQAAQRRSLHLPLVTGDDKLEEAFERPTDFAHVEANDTQARERRSRWWSFLKR